MVTPVDEIVDIYEKFDESVYDMFINESLKIFERYKIECNSKNKKLVLVSSECDGSFKNKYTHGGYECGDNGLWSKKCVPSYCDIGYIFDHKEHKCIIDICSDKQEGQEEEEEEKDEGNGGKKEDEGINIFYYILFPILGVILIIGIIILYITCNKYRAKKLKKTDVDNQILIPEI